VRVERRSDEISAQTAADALAGYTARMAIFLAAFTLSAALTLLMVHVLRTRGWVTKDHDLSGPQKVHLQPVGRVGGVAVFVSLCVFAAWEQWRGSHFGGVLALLLLCGAPVLVVGLIEDLTKRVAPWQRLLAAAVSALLAVVFIGTAIPRTDIWGLDWVASFAIGAAALSVFAVSGIANAINIIDGFNGLASMCVMMILLAVAYVALQVNDGVVLALALVGAGAVLGFFIWNYPAGLIFLGDGGAYFLGFYLSEVALLLIIRNPQVSPLFPLLVAIYPIFETIFSMYRRRFVKGRPVGMPDGAHLHSLVHRRLLRWAIGRDDASALMRRNAMTAPYLWALCMSAIVPSVLFWDESAILGMFILLFIVVYVVLYGQIVRFKAPRWLVHKR
jgi:UDP-N-acetylmuramyl pentapeptide phosphotransferase/UDP-N-acetylglucosamine-1-phosphate transferase